ncbi:nicotinate phosphoribosyltransferase [Azospira restricta]|uniref:Nicotinate phosphoribosyltransferase n=1 Tax=Azospira restricta TaxID=404405 RepID=A0A974SLF5_9RHOO|nr:nicotinate phosphoribosyltransferase [Azospira restricta]QRJ62201.1 nicotinate phosphoribosyltransferase [Azospira restricta]
MRESALLTDLYQLTMLQSYFDEGMNDTAVFEFFVRRLPPRRGFLVAAGLEQVLDYLEGLRFSPEELEWLAAGGRFSPAFLASLADFRFSGDVEAMPEGTPFFADEPILRVVAPLREAQFVETRIINLLQYQTLVAAKAARVRLAAPGKLLVDFGLRRAHGAEAGLLSARASYLAGFDGTATVLAGMRWDIPLFGTMAHSFVQAHDDESEAFARFARSHPAATTLLIDTYDTEVAAAAVVPLARRLAADGIAIKAVRIDSGDLAEHARRVRAILDAGGLPEIRIFASGNLDEDAVRALVAAGAPIDGFGVGTRMNTAADQPWLDCAYKLQEYAGRPRRKRSEGKATWPGRKQVFRRVGTDGRVAGDTLTLLGETAPGEPLLQPVMRGGRRLAPAPPLAALRDAAQAAIAALPPELTALDATPAVAEVAPALRELARQADRAQAHGASA